MEIKFKESRANLATRSGTVVSISEVGGSGRSVDGRKKDGQGGQGKGAGRGIGAPFVLDYSS